MLIEKRRIEAPAINVRGHWYREMEGGEGEDLDVISGGLSCGGVWSWSWSS
jgi:hypothetical protein